MQKEHKYKFYLMRFTQNVFEEIKLVHLALSKTFNDITKRLFDNRHISLLHYRHQLHLIIIILIVLTNINGIFKEYALN